MPGSFTHLLPTLFSVLQVFAVALQKSYRSKVGLHCPVIRLRWQYPLKLAVCQMYTHTFWQGSTNFLDIWQLPPNSRCQKCATKQVPYQAPSTLEWPDTLTGTWRFPSCMWTKCMFVYTGQNCNNYAEDIGCHHTKLSCLFLTRCLGCVNPCILVWTVKHLTTLPVFYNIQFTFHATLYLRN